jgi:hypothetical protein
LVLDDQLEHDLVQIGALIPTIATSDVIELGRDNPGRNEARGGLIVEESGDEVEGLIDKPQAIEHHRFDCFTDRETSHFRVLLGRSIKDIPNAEFVEHASDKAEVVQDCVFRSNVGSWPILVKQEECVKIWPI